MSDNERYCSLSNTPKDKNQAFPSNILKKYGCLSYVKRHPHAY